VFTGPKLSRLVPAIKTIIMENEVKPMTTKELTSAVSLLLEREETRIAQEGRKQRRRVRRRRAETHDSISQLTHSIETIKWCIVGIATVMAVSLVILIAVVWQLGNEVEKIRGEAETMVQQIESEAEKIRDRIQNPLRTIGGALGGQLDQRLGGALGLENE
jgi:Na+-transporting methylmalonyl-CoA/oxaloacetate decarboxylase gamma subunit